MVLHLRVDGISFAVAKVMKLPSWILLIAAVEILFNCAPIWAGPCRAELKELSKGSASSELEKQMDALNGPAVFVADTVEFYRGSPIANESRKILGSLSLPPAKLEFALSRETKTIDQAFFGKHPVSQEFLDQADQIGRWALATSRRIEPDYDLEIRSERVIRVLDAKTLDLPWHIDSYLNDDGRLVPIEKGAKILRFLVNLPTESANASTELWINKEIVPVLPGQTAILSFKNRLRRDPEDLVFARHRAPPHSQGVRYLYQVDVATVRKK